MDSKINITIYLTTIKILLIIYIALLASIFFVKGDMFMPVVFAAGGYGVALWIIIFADIINSRIYNKTFWIWSMFILPTMVILVYPFVKGRLISQDK